MIDKKIFKKTEDILKDYQQLDAEIKCLELEINNIKNNYEGCGAIGYEERTQSTNKFNSSVENEIINKEKEIARLTILLNDKKTLKEQIDTTMENMLETERKLIKLKYLNTDELSWRQVACMLGFDKDHIRKKIRVNAINKLAVTIFINKCKQERMDI